MNNERSSGAAVLKGEKVVGMLTDRSLLRHFIPLNKRPDQVKVGEVMGPLLRIEAETSTKVAAKKIVENRFTRLGVFDGDTMLGWVTVTDLAREASKKRLVDALLRHNEPEERDILCPNCRQAFLEKVVNDEGQILRWECSKCKFAL
jgi:signal-transduction protein with cAMP-binding, CBS, and nucleotidyltransferase domain